MSLRVMLKSLGTDSYIYFCYWLCIKFVLQVYFFFYAFSIFHSTTMKYDCRNAAAVAIHLLITLDF